MEIDSDGWSNCHGKIVAQSVESDSFISPACRKNVDGAGAVGNRYGSERTSVQGSADGKHQDGAGCNIAGKEDGEGRETDHQNLLARKAVNHISAERTNDEGGNRIAAQHNSNHIFRGSKIFAQIEREQRCEQIEGEIQQKVGSHHLDVVCIPKFLFHHFLEFVLTFRVCPHY